MDALLDDLCEFDPMKEVGSKQPKPPVPLPVTPPVKHIPPQPEPFQPPSPLHHSVTQPPPVRPKPTPNGVTPQQVLLHVPFVHNEGYSLIKILIMEGRKITTINLLGFESGIT